MTGRPPNPRILIVAASKHGGTAEIADQIAKTLESRGLEVTVADPGSLTEIDGYGVVILGSAVYAGHWLGDARQLAEQVVTLDPAPMVWLFSSGPIGDPPKPEDDPVDIADIQQQIGARGHKVFAGKIDKSKLSFGERAIMIAVRAPEGDFRDWHAIAAWANDIGDTISGADGI